MGATRAPGDSALISAWFSLVVGFVVVVELDAVLGGKLGVLVIRRLVVIGGPFVATSKAEIERSGSGLLQFSRLFETAMTTLLHDRAPTLES